MFQSARSSLYIRWIIALLMVVFVSVIFNCFYFKTKLGRLRQEKLYIPAIFWWQKMGKCQTFFEMF